MMDHDQAQLERLSFFSDAVFAIAMTLLVVEVRVPELERLSEAELGTALLQLLPQYIGFLSSFLVIGRFWVTHHRLFGMLRASDARLVWANLFLLLGIAFMPFPTAVLSHYVQLRVGVGLYAAWLVILGLLNRRLNRVALAGRRLARDEVDEATIRTQLRQTWIAVLIGATTFVAGMVVPVAALFALALGGPVIGWLIRRREARGYSGPDGAIDS